MNQNSLANFATVVVMFFYSFCTQPLAYHCFRHQLLSRFSWAYYQLSPFQAHRPRAIQKDIRLLHRKHSFSKTSKEFSVGETIGTAHSDRGVAQRVPRAEGRLRSERSHQKEGYLTLSPGGGRETKRERYLLEVPKQLWSKMATFAYFANIHPH